MMGRVRSQPGSWKKCLSKREQTPSTSTSLLMAGKTELVLFTLKRKIYLEKWTKAKRNGGGGDLLYLRKKRVRKSVSE